MSASSSQPPIELESTTRMPHHAANAASPFAEMASTCHDMADSLSRRAKAPLAASAAAAATSAFDSAAATASAAATVAIKTKARGEREVGTRGGGLSSAAGGPAVGEAAGSGKVAAYLHDAMVREVAQLRATLEERLGRDEQVPTLLRPVSRCLLSRFKLVLVGAFVVHLLIYWHLAAEVIRDGEASIELSKAYLIIVLPVCVGVSAIALTFPSSHRQLVEFKTDALDALERAMSAMRARAEALRAERDSRVEALSSSFRRVMSRHSEALQAAINAHLRTIQENLEQTWTHFRHCLVVMHGALARLNCPVPAWLTVEGLIDGLQRRVERTAADSEGRMLSCTVKAIDHADYHNDGGGRASYVLPAASFVAIARELDARSRRGPSGGVGPLNDPRSRLMFTVQLEKLSIEATTAALLRRLEVAMAGVAIEQRRRLQEAAFGLSTIELGELGGWRCCSRRWQVGYWAQRERISLLGANLTLIFLSLFMGLHGCTESECAVAVPAVLMLHMVVTLSMIGVAVSSKGVYELRLAMKDLVLREAASFSEHVLNELRKLPGDVDFLHAMEDVTTDDDKVFEHCTHVVEAWKERVRAFEQMVRLPR